MNGSIIAAEYGYLIDIEGTNGRWHVGFITVDPATGLATRSSVVSRHSLRVEARRAAERLAEHACHIATVSRATCQ